MVTQIIYSDEYNKHSIESHPENAERTNVLFKELRKVDFIDKLNFVKPNKLPELKLSDVHSKRMINQIKERSIVDVSWIDLDTYVCKNDYHTSLLAAGGVVSACDNVLNNECENAFALVRPPGHHATSIRSMGFCLFNNIAIAANELTKKGFKVLINDFDVHHGNGTQDIFYDRSDVLYQSFHLSPHFPGTGDIDEVGLDKGEGYSINVPLAYGYGDKAIIDIYEEIFLPIASQFKPDFILLSAGYDSHHADPLGGLKLTANTYGTFIEKFKQIQPNIVSTIEGGYNLDWIGKCMISQIASMCNEKKLFDDETVQKQDYKKIIDEVKDKVGNYWKI